MKNLFLLIAIVMIYFNSNSQTTGTLSFSVTTLNYSATFSPKHILAIWIEDSSGVWVKTRKFRSQNINFRSYLTNFKNATNSTYNSVDAITGSTLLQHSSHTITWDCKDVNGNIVSDGNYKIFIEFTSANTTGKLFSVVFTKGPQAQTLTPVNQTNFSNISLTWTPSITQIDKAPIIDPIKVFPNPFNKEVNISNLAENKNTIQIYSITGELINKFIDCSNSINWDGKDFNGNVIENGQYIIIVNSNLYYKIIKM